MSDLPPDFPAAPRLDSQLAPDDRPELRCAFLTRRTARARLAACPLAWLPVGCLEKHGDHLPMGLDPIKAELICLAGARALGGLVFPAHFYSGVHRFQGTPEGDFHVREWGDLYTYRSTETHLIEILDQIARIGARAVVLFSGHHPRAQMELLQRVAAHFRVLAPTAADPLVVIPGDERTLLGEGDHAGIWETSLLLHRAPARVDLRRIDDTNRRDHQWTDATDARRASAAQGAQRLAAILAELRSRLQAACPALPLQGPKPAP